MSKYVGLDRITLSCPFYSIDFIIDFVVVVDVLCVQAIDRSRRSRKQYHRHCFDFEWWTSTKNCKYSSARVCLGCFYWHKLFFFNNLCGLGAYWYGRRIVSTYCKYCKWRLIFSTVLSGRTTYPKYTCSIQICVHRNGRLCIPICVHTNMCPYKDVCSQPDHNNNSTWSTNMYR